MKIEGAECDGIDLGGNGSVLRDSAIRYNGGTRCSDPGVGGGVYSAAESLHNGHGVQISNNTITDNYGTAIDINGVDDGIISNNTVLRNGGIAGIAIYQGYSWTVTGNNVNESGGSGSLRYHPYCQPPAGNVRVGIWLCSDVVANSATFNWITGNGSRGYYGILLIGKDPPANLVPLCNTIVNNDVYGSNVGCADDDTPGSGGANTWNGNNCGGPGGAPAYF